MNLFRSAKVEIDVGGDGWTLFAAKDHHIARELARLTGTYKDYRFKAGDEAQFRVKNAEIGKALLACNIQHLTAAALLNLASGDTKVATPSVRA